MIGTLGTGDTRDQNQVQRGIPGEGDENVGDLLSMWPIILKFNVGHGQSETSRYFTHRPSACLATKSHTRRLENLLGILPFFCVH